MAIFVCGFEIRLLDMRASVSSSPITALTRSISVAATIVHGHLLGGSVADRRGNARSDYQLVLLVSLSSVHYMNHYTASGIIQATSRLPRASVSAMRPSLWPKDLQRLYYLLTNP